MMHAVLVFLSQKLLSQNAHTHHTHTYTYPHTTYTYTLWADTLLAAVCGRVRVFSLFPQHLCFGSPFLRPCGCRSRILRTWISPAASATGMGGSYCSPPSNTFYTEGQIQIPANLILPSITCWSPANLVLLKVVSRIQQT